MENSFSAYYSSPLGQIKISSTDTYIHEIHFWDKPETVHVSMISADPIPPVLQACLDQLIEYFHGRRRVFEIPVHQEGTHFQQRVWNELLTIPFGKTISYLELAKRLGDPRAIRAVAATNGKNKIAVIVPCHRVIGSNRDLVGYAGGLWRKKWLLDQEAKQLYGIQTLF
jgi:methylated-DNA-[protein]-cysteine S-methyltransferase